jgi:hypothetical protein
MKMDPEEQLKRFGFIRRKITSMLFLNQRFLRLIKTGYTKALEVGLILH